jgi:DNA modification methylase
MEAEQHLVAGETGTGRHQRNHSGAQAVVRNRIRGLQRVRARDLVTNPKNWRIHGKAQKAAMRALLEEVGYADALLARQLPDGTYMLIDGHLRAELTPDQEVPILVLDVSEEEADKILLTLDPLAAMAETDPERIKSLIESVTTNSPAIDELIKRTAGEDIWSTIHPDEVREVEVAPDRAEELRTKWATELSQVWEAGAHRLICGDSRDQSLVDQLFRDDSFRLIWTDPPYGVSYSDKTEWLNTNGGGRRRRAIANDSLQPAELQILFGDALKSSVRHALPGASIYATAPSQYLKYFIQGLEDGGFSYRHCLVWVKQNFVMGRADYHYRHEPILYGWLANGPHFFIDERNHDSVFEVDRPTASELHPTVKPIELIAEMIKNSTLPGDRVYDPFAGSGSTIVAAHQLGRVGYGCEIDPAYLAVELERLSRLGLKPELVR